jgi:DNA gyrase subunit B
LRQQAYLTKGVRINIIDRRPKTPAFYGFYFEGGVLSFVKFLAQKRTRSTKIFFM